MSLGTGLGLGALMMVIVQPGASAQPAQQAQRRHDEQARMALDPAELEVLQKEQRLVLDYGLWVNQLFTDFADDDNDADAPDATDETFAIDERFWARATLRPPAGSASTNEHSVYVRLKNKNTWRDPSDVHGRHDWNGPHVDYLFLTADLRPWLLQAGRRYYSVGQGIAYSNVNDGAELMYSAATWSLMGFVSRTLPHEDNVDLSVPGGKKSGRTFYGLEGKFLGIPNHGVYGYTVWQRDDSDENPDDPIRDYDYNSEYVGVGTEGKLFANLRYTTEFILETGESVTSVTQQQQDIRAWAMDLSATYDVQLPTQPTLYAEYAFGSGDADRNNVTDTVDGNAVGKDRNFLYFGYLPTGYALSPRLSNLRMLKAGMAFKPLERLPRFKDLSVSVDVYRYFKDEPAGAIFDFEASQRDRDVGYEVDLTLAWQILSDVSLAIEYGRFEPGAAYPSGTNDETTYFSAGVTTTF